MPSTALRVGIHGLLIYWSSFVLHCSKLWFWLATPFFRTAFSRSCSSISSLVHLIRSFPICQAISVIRHWRIRGPICGSFRSHLVSNMMTWHAQSLFIPNTPSNGRITTHFHIHGAMWPSKFPYHWMVTCSSLRLIWKELFETWDVWRRQSEGNNCLCG